MERSTPRVRFKSQVGTVVTCACVLRHAEIKTQQSVHGLSLREVGISCAASPTPWALSSLASRTLALVSAIFSHSSMTSLVVQALGPDSGSVLRLVLSPL